MTFEVRNTMDGERDEFIAVTTAAFTAGDAVAIVRYVWNHDQGVTDLDLVAVDGDARPLGGAAARLRRRESRGGLPWALPDVLADPEGVNA